MSLPAAKLNLSFETVRVLEKRAFTKVPQILNNLNIMSLKPHNKKTSSEPLYESSFISKPVVITTERPSNNLMPSISSRERRRRHRELLGSGSDAEDSDVENKDINKETLNSPVKLNSGHEHYHDHKTPQEDENKMAPSKSSKRRKRKQKKQFSPSGSDSSGQEDGKNW